jgi:MscS family membrane protein
MHFNMNYPLNVFSEFYFGNNPQIWYVAGTIILAWIIKRFVSKRLARFFIKQWNRTHRIINEESFLTLLVRPLEVVFFWVVIFSLEKLDLPLTVKSYPLLGKTTLYGLFNILSLIILIGLIIWLLLRIIDYVALVLEARANQTVSLGDNQLIVFFKDFFKVMLVFCGFLLVLKFAFGQHIGNLLTGLSIVGAAIALATRESLENLIASFVIFFDKPFTTGDFVKVQHVSGVVEKIGLRSARIRTESKTYVSVPNKQMADSIVDNYSLRTHRRGFINIEIDAAAGTEKITLLIGRLKQILEEQKTLDSYSVFLNEIRQSVCAIPVEYFTAPIDMEDFNHIKNDIHFKIIGILEELQVKLAKLPLQPPPANIV